MKFSAVLRNLALATIIVGGYFLLGKLGLNLATINSNTSPIWPASGFAAGMLIIFGVRYWPAVFIASFLVNYTIQTPMFSSTLMAAGNTLEAILAAVLFVPAKNWFNKIRLRRIAGAVFVVAAFTPMVSATLGTLSVYLTQPLATSLLIETWTVWWCGNFLGMLFVLPLILILVDHDPEWSFLWAKLKTAKSILGILIGAYFIIQILDFVLINPKGGGFIFLIFPILLISLFGLGIIGLRLVTILVFTFAAIGTYLDVGPFSLGSPQADYFQLQIFMVIFAVSSLSIGELYRTAQFRGLFIVLFCSWFLSGVIFYSFYDGLVDRDQKRFNQLSNDLADQFQQKFSLYENVLRAGAARLTGLSDVSPEHWKNFVETLQLKENYPGLNGLAVLYEVPTSRFSSFQEMQNNAYKGQFNIKSLPDRSIATDLSYPNQYIMTHVEPLNENFRAHGMNVTADPKRVAAAIESRHNGKPSVTEPVFLVQDQVSRIGYAMMYPVPKFAASENIKSAWIVAPYAISRVVESMTNPIFHQVNYLLIEEKGHVSDVLFASQTGLNSQSMLRNPKVAKRPLKVGQRDLTILVERNPIYFGDEDYFLAWIGALSALLSLMIAWMYVDIYAFKERAEELAQKKTKELSRRENLWLTVMKAAPVGLFHLDHEGQHVYRNAKIDEITGMTPDELHHLQRTIGENGPNEFPIVQAGKDPVWVKGISAPIHNDEGEVTGTVGILVDITEKRNQELQLENQRMRTLHASKMATLGEMAGGIAHEINNPLAIISAKAQMLSQLSDKIQPSAIREYADRIEQTVQRIAAIVRGMRTFSRNGENDPMTISELQTIVNDTLEFCRGNLSRHEITLDVSIEPDLILECRPTQISQVILNLINNAQDAIQNYEEKWIRVAASSNRGVITIKVTDSGKGIRTDIAERMMQPFFTTKDVGKGTGLGLSISRGIIEDHHGHLYLDESAPNTCFVIELPEASAASKVA